MRPELLHIWAKTTGSGTTTEAGEGASPFHPLVYHLLDVAAVAEGLLVQSTALGWLAARLSLAREDLARRLVFGSALHDIGKCAAHFQILVPALWPGHACPALGALPAGRLTTRPHGDITDLYLRDRRTDENPDKAGPLTAILRRGMGRVSDCEGLIVSAIAGHHGLPTAHELPEISGDERRINEPFCQAATEIGEALLDVLGEAATPQLAGNGDGAVALSWFLSALLPVADWVGSNQLWFPARRPGLTPADYWRACARPQAERALGADGAGLARARLAAPSPGRTFRHLQGAGLTPVQDFAFSCQLGEAGTGRAGPWLFLIEDATGSGKTEAAMALVHRLMAAGAGDGFYFGQPTMATANAMYARLAETYLALFAEGERPALALAHGKAAHHAQFLASLRDTQGGNGAGEPDNAAWCSGWIADSRRKALLAQAGAGTIDQALMAILPLRYQSLRLHGLIGKVLILDEIHSFDPYMQTLIETLLELHARLGGSAVLMSATLPVKTRQALVTAFERGLKQPAQERRRLLTFAQAGEAQPKAQIASRAYPLVTMLDATGLAEMPLPLAPASARRVAVRRVATVAEAEALARKMAASGAAVALMRSTVDAAIASFERLKATHEATDLFHARFLLEDRLAIEQDVLARFGKSTGKSTGKVADKASGAQARLGRILVATQVIEQSLDIDFDVFITDLAPIDLLIQRAGRLWRHRREERPVAAPVLHVISPAPDETSGANWLDADLVEARWVYGDVARLWLTARRLFAAGEIVTATLAEGEESPAHVRTLVEAVYAAGADEVPTDDLREVLNEFTGKDMGNEGIARQVMLRPGDGYVRSQAWMSEARAQTRLELTLRVPVRLARRDGAQLRPLGADWAASEVRLNPNTFAKGLTPPDAAETAQLFPPWAEADEGALLLVLAREGAGWRSPDGRFAYDATRGLRQTRAGDEAADAG